MPEHRYPTGLFEPAILTRFAFVHCYVGAMTALDSPEFRYHLRNHPQIPYTISLSHGGVIDLNDGSPLMERLKALQGEGRKVEIFPYPGRAWIRFDSHENVTVDCIRVAAS